MEQWECSDKGGHVEQQHIEHVHYVEQVYFWVRWMLLKYFVVVLYTAHTEVIVRFWLQRFAHHTLCIDMFLCIRKTPHTTTHIVH